MVSSYQISERVNLQTVLWAMATGISAAGRACAVLSALFLAAGGVAVMGGGR